MCRSMVDIQSPTAEIRRGKKRRKKKKQDENIYVSLLHRATIITTAKHTESRCDWVRTIKVSNRVSKRCVLQVTSGLRNAVTDSISTRHTTDVINVHWQPVHKTKGSSHRQLFHQMAMDCHFHRRSPQYHRKKSEHQKMDQSQLTDQRQSLRQSTILKFKN